MALPLKGVRRNGKSSLLKSSEKQGKVLVFSIQSLDGGTLQLENSPVDGPEYCAQASRNLQTILTNTPKNKRNARTR